MRAPSLARVLQPSLLLSSRGRSSQYSQSARAPRSISCAHGMLCCCAATQRAQFPCSVCMRCAEAGPLALLHASREAADAQCPAGTHRTWATPTEVGAKAEAAATRAAATAVFMYMIGGDVTELLFAGRNGSKLVTGATNKGFRRLPPNCFSHRKSENDSLFLLLNHSRWLIDLCSENRVHKMERCTGNCFVNFLLSSL